MKINLTDIIKKQPLTNLGFFGSVSHGKSSLVYALTGIKTQRHSKELERNISINLGYTEIKLYNKENELSYKQLPDYTLYNKISLVDTPGHKALITTMISGTLVTDYAILVIAMNESIPQSQTINHVNILKHTGVKDILIILNKIDLLSNETEVNKRLTELKFFIESNQILQNRNIIPISAFKNINVEKIINFLSKTSIKNINEKVNKEFCMNILRSFDINRANVSIDNLQGGVVGGTILQGSISVGDTIIISPGIIDGDTCTPLITQVKSIFADKTQLQTAYPGGLISLGLDCDPSFCKQNALIGSTISKTFKNVINEFIIEITYLKEPSLFQSLTNIIVLYNSKSIKTKIKKRNNCKLHVHTEFPIVEDYTIKLPILTLLGDTYELFAMGKIVEVINSLEIKNKFDIELKDENITIVDDLTEISFKKENYTLEHIKELILPHIRTINNNKLVLPEICITKEPTRLLWHNYTEYLNFFKLDTQDTHLKIISMKDCICGYIRYIYNIENESVSLTNNLIIVHIKTRGLKMKLEDIIKNFFEKYYKCLKCNEYTLRIGKSGSKFSSICFMCSTKNTLNEKFLS
jgi:translation initiation factor 2 subunit 3